MKKMLILALGAILAAGTGWAQTPPETDLLADDGQVTEGRTYSGEKITLDFQNTDIWQVISVIGEFSGKNIVAPDTIKGRVTLKIKDMPWDQALDIVLGSLGLGFEETGNVLIVYELNRPGGSWPPTGRVPETPEINDRQ